VKSLQISSMNAIKEFYGIGTSDGSVGKIKGTARLLLTIAVVALIFAISGTADPTWVSASNTIGISKDGGGDTEDVTRHFKYGLSEAVTVTPQYIPTLKERYTEKSSGSPNAAIVGASIANALAKPNEAPTLPDGSKNVPTVFGMMVAGLFFLIISMILMVVQFFTGANPGGVKGGLVMYYATGALMILSGLLLLVGAIVFATGDDEKVLCYGYENFSIIRDGKCGLGAAFALSLIAGLITLVVGIVYFVLLKLAAVATVKGAGAVAGAASA